MAISQPLPGSINAPLGIGQQSGVNNNGGFAVIKFTGLSSDLTTAGVVLCTAFGGDIEIDNCIFCTDATGLAGGTNLELSNSSAIGLTIFFSEAVASLGGNKTVDFYTATVGQRSVIANGKSISIISSVANCTGAGQWTLYIIYRPCVESAQLTV